MKRSFGFLFMAAMMALGAILFTQLLHASPAAASGCGANPCAGIYSPGFWANNHPGVTDAQFQSYLDQTTSRPSPSRPPSVT